MNNLTVTKSNNLLDASYRLNAQAQKFLLCCIAKVNPEDRPRKTMTITASQFAELMGIDLKIAYRDLYDAADSLFNSSIILKEDNEDIELVWIQKKAKKIKGEGQVTITWSDDVLKYLTQLSSKFKSYQLRQIANLDSAHAIRLYEILIRFEDTGWREMRVEDFKIAMGVTGKYIQYKELNRRVLSPAIKQINKHSNLTVTLTPKKRGLKIYKLRFDFTVDDQMELPLND
jgi:plasmid replication initiation protein